MFMWWSLKRVLVQSTNCTGRINVRKSFTCSITCDSVGEWSRPAGDVVTSTMPCVLAEDVFVLDTCPVRPPAPCLWGGNLLSRLLTEAQSDEFQDRKTSDAQRDVRTRKQTWCTGMGLRTAGGVFTAACHQTAVKIHQTHLLWLLCVLNLRYGWDIVLTQSGQSQHKTKRLWVNFKHKQVERQAVGINFYVTCKLLINVHMLSSLLLSAQLLSFVHNRSAPVAPQPADCKYILSSFHSILCSCSCCKPLIAVTRLQTNISHFQSCCGTLLLLIKEL